MSLLIPDNEQLFRIFDLVESEVTFLFLEKISGKKIVTPRTIKNILSGKHKPKRSLSESMSRFHVDKAVINQTELLTQEVLKKLGPGPKYRRHTVSWTAFSEGLRNTNLLYVADVIDGIVTDNEKILATKESRQLTEICRNPTVLNILCKDEIETIRNADIHAKTMPTLILLRLKILLYIFAAFEINGFYSEEKFPDTSARIANGKYNAVGVLFEILVESEKCKYTTFARKYLTDEDGDEDSAVKQLRRWRKGEVTPSWKSFLKFADKLCKDRASTDSHDSCMARIMLLFALAVFSHNVAEEENHLKLNLEWGKTYEQFLHAHIIAIKKRGQNN